MMTDYPDRLRVDTNDESIYEQLKHEKIFNKFERKDLFIFAMLKGAQCNQSVPLGKSMAWVLGQYLNEEDLSIIKSIAAQRAGLEILEDKARVFQIAEELAHGGINLIKVDLQNTQYGPFSDQIENSTIQLLLELRKTTLNPKS